jgi:hypothetical protein
MTTLEEYICTMRPASCAPGTAPAVLASSSKPNWPSDSPSESLISGIRGTHARPRKPRRKNMPKSHFVHECRVEKESEQAKTFGEGIL